LLTETQTDDQQETEDPSATGSIHDRPMVM
jgi:hypothetical protein